MQLRFVICLNRHTDCNNISEGYKAFVFSLTLQEPKKNQTRLTSRSFKLLLYVLVLASSLYVGNIQLSSRLHVQFFFLIKIFEPLLSLLVFAASCSISGQPLALE